MSKTLKELTHKWYGILKQKGFVDLEDAKGNLKEETAVRQYAEWARERYSILGSSEKPNRTGKLARSQQNELRLETRSEYYRLARHFFETYKHFRPGDKRVWALHADGLSYRKIAGQCKRHLKHSTRMSIWRRIQELRVVMLQPNWDLRPQKIV